MDDPELKLVIAACRTAYDGGEANPGDPSDIDWVRFARLTERHRVEALCWHGLSGAQQQVPLPIATSLGRAAGETVECGMRMAIECRRLKGIFDRADIDLIFVKGVTLGALAYSNPFLKMSVDIDVLVGPDQLRSAVTALNSAGYRPIVPTSAGEERVERWHRRRKESVWRHSSDGLQLDLHSRLADHPALLPGIGVASPRQNVTVAPGIELPTLALEELFAYLCVHGASSAWFRLKWACDLAALVKRLGNGKLETLYDRSQQLGAGRAAAQALLVLEAVFGIGLPVALRDRLQADQANRWLTDMALQQLKSETEPLERRLGTMSIHLSQLLLLPGAGYPLSELGRQARFLLEPEGR